jgi:hypothetical protein
VTDEVMGKAILQSKFKLRIEYYRYQYSDNYSKIKTIVYINGIESCRSETGYYLYNVARDYNKFIFKTAGGAEVYLDNLISENDKIAFRDADGNVIADPKNPVFPMGGAGGTKEPDESYNGRIDFEDAFLGIPSIPGLTTKPNSNEFGNDIEVAQDPANADNKTLLISTGSSTRAGNRALVVPYDAMVGANCYVLEWDMYIADGSVPYYQFKLGDCFMLELRGSTTLRILTKSSNPTDGSGRIEALLGKGHKLTTDEWHNIRIEYYCGTAETVKILVYVDGSVYETNHFYGKGANIVGEPTNSYDAENPVVFYSAYDCSADVYFDNIVAEKIIKDYPVIDNGDPDVPDDGGDGSDPDDPGEGGGTGTDKPEGGTEKPTEPDENGGIEINPDYVPSEGEPFPDDINPNWSNP